jgi:CRP/FNR family cyclic AMP-dependent transcriptional regulator
MPVDPALVGGITLFRSMDDDERRALAAVMDLKAVGAGETVFRESEPGDELLCVVDGRLDTLVNDFAGQEIVLDAIGPGDTVGELSMLDGRPRSATLRCSEDARLLVLGRDELLRVLPRAPHMALDMMAQMAARARRVDDLLRSRVARNVNEEVEQKRTAVERVADAIAAFSGSIPFLVLHTIWFVIWIAWNTALPRGFDPYPFGLLTMIVSLEAIFLSVFVLLSQNRQASKDRVRADIEYDVNVKAEMEVAALHAKMDRLHEEIVARLRRMGRELEGGTA